VNHSILGILLGLFGGPFIHEDATIVAAAYLVTEQGLPWLWVWLAVFGGMVASDSVIYGLGAAARLLPVLRRKLIGPRIEKMRERLDKNLAVAVSACHIVPGILFTTFTACGWFGIPYRRFMLFSALAAGIYSIIMLFLVMAFGQVLLRYIGTWGWLVVALILVVFIIRNRLRPAPVARHLTGPVSTHDQPLASHTGMPPPPDGCHPRTSLAEHIPPYIFYTPLVLRWLLLGMRYHSLLLPTIANPKIKIAGLWGESKSELMNQIGPDYRRWVAPFVTLRRAAGETLAAGDIEKALEAMRGAGLEFPLVAKPDCGWQGYGVQRIKTAENLKTYLESYPGGETLLLQKIASWDGEAGVFYVRYPGQDHGRIESMAFRYFPFVIGNGRSTVRDLIAKDERASFKQKFHLGQHWQHKGAGNELLGYVPAAGEMVRLSFIGSIRVGGLYYDAQTYVTQALNDRFDAICRSMPDFYFGRFDIRFKSVEQLQKAEDFAIIEINGAGSEAIHVWDPRKPLRDVYRDLFRFQSAMFEISALNRSHGFCPLRSAEFLKETLHYKNLLRRYPPSG
jgi:membrane protein DedA with SNARE-associated domain